MVVILHSVKADDGIGGDEKLEGVAVIKFLQGPPVPRLGSVKREAVLEIGGVGGVGGDEGDGETGGGGFQIERESTTDDEATCLVLFGLVLDAEVRDDLIDGDVHDDAVGEGSGGGARGNRVRSEERFERKFGWS